METNTQNLNSGLKKKGTSDKIIALSATFFDFSGEVLIQRFLA
jgi:hypothetical protein